MRLPSSSGSDTTDAREIGQTLARLHAAIAMSCSTADERLRSLEQAAAKNAPPVKSFARVVSETQVVSSKGAAQLYRTDVALFASAKDPPSHNELPLTKLHHKKDPGPQT
jgi:hypothetical protein